MVNPYLVSLKGVLTEVILTVDHIAIFVNKPSAM